MGIEGPGWSESVVMGFFISCVKTTFPVSITFVIICSNFSHGINVAFWGVFNVYNYNLSFFFLQGLLYVLVFVSLVFIFCHVKIFINQFSVFLS